MHLEGPSDEAEIVGALCACCRDEETPRPDGFKMVMLSGSREGGYPMFAQIP